MRTLKLAIYLAASLLLLIALRPSAPGEPGVEGAYGDVPGKLDALRERAA